MFVFFQVNFFFLSFFVVVVVVEVLGRREKGEKKGSVKRGAKR